MSLCYDRPCVAFVHGSTPRIPHSSHARGLTYLESCYGVATVLNDIYHEWMYIRRAGSSTLPAVRFQFATEQILLWEASAQEHLRSRASCKDEAQRVHHDAFQIFVNFYIFQLNRHQLTTSPLFADDLQADIYSRESLQGGQETVDDQTLACMNRCETILRLFLSLRKSHYQVSRLWLLVHICLGCSFYLASSSNKARARAELEKDLEVEHRRARQQLLREVVNNLEQNPPYSVHPHQDDILKTLKQVIGIAM